MGLVYFPHGSGRSKIASGDLAEIRFAVRQKLGKDFARERIPRDG